MKIPQLRRRAIETTLSHIHPRSFLLPGSQANVFYDQMTQISSFLYKCLIVRIFFYSIYEFNYLRRNLTDMQPSLSEECLPLTSCYGEEAS
jgi:hypothetical protein